ncbi:MAG: sarcosine oxidase subunit alpha family protein [Alphaproteobacteria bacterium]|nr:sarcosine oxidase subunit alpha family protein [Alphaproteobacteria bacterium]
MSDQPFRMHEGGGIDRARPLGFTFDGKRYSGFAGDSLASALLANGVRLVGRSFKYHRPRGIMSAGPEEPNALVRLRTGNRIEPNTRATMIELFDGLVAESQNRWPSLDLDFGAVASLFAPLIPAGFYYKTFMAPKGAWLFYERFIRAAAGMGAGGDAPDPDHYEKRHAHCDVLVIGGGPAGLATALAAGRAGARVILVDEMAELGGAVRREDAAVSGMPAREWLASTLAELESLPEIRLLRRATAFGHYDHNLVAVVERVADHLAVPPPHFARQVTWLVRASQVVYATGAIERPLVFANNDRPNIMLAGAARAYVNAFGVAPGTRAVVFTNNDSAYATALDLQRAGVQIAAVIDPREDSAGDLPRRARDAGIACRFGEAVITALGTGRVTGVETIALGAGHNGHGDELGCDLLCVSGGWSPTLHLHCQSGGRPAWNEALAAFVPGRSKQAERSAGAVAGTFDLVACIADGLAAGAAAAQAAGVGDGARPTAPDWPRETTSPLRPLWSVPARPGKKAFVDFQDDVTASDIGLAAREGYRSVEHLKRYTTLGMGTDQGKTSNVNGLALLAELRGEAIPAVGVTTFRPPYTPVAIGNFAGRDTGRHFEPIRRTAIHRWHETAGAVFMEAGLWLRPSCYPRAGESERDAIRRETLEVRNGVGLVDVSTLGKIEIAGPDAALFLDRVYCNTFSTLAVGRARYGLMLREDGIVFDDGTTSRLADDLFIMTTTTANAVAVMQHLEFLLQVVWPELRVAATSITEQWAAMALAGPASREVLSRVADGADVGDAALPHMGAQAGSVAGAPARIFRISFSGERAYEINVPADYGQHVWTAIIEAGRSSGIVPYGVEAMGVMRIEKGHVTGAELDGTTTAEDVGLGRMVAMRKADFIGRHAVARTGLIDPRRHRLVGLVPVDGKTRLRAGMQIVADSRVPPPVPMIGRVTSVAQSPMLNHPIALGLVEGGIARKGETLHALFPLADQWTAVRVTDPVFYDPKGERLHG